MASKFEALAGQVSECFGDAVERLDSRCGELGYELPAGELLRIATILRDDERFAFDTLVDLCAVDYLDYGRDEWKTRRATTTGFSRGVEQAAPGVESGPARERRYAVVYHLLSVARNQRLRLKVYPAAVEPPIVPSVIEVWPSANWYEREAFDLFGILFDGHPDLRRILTDYGFVGHPFRKDFPLIGNVEVRYDEEQGRVIYQPVSIEPRTLVPRVIRDDHRYEAALRESDADG